MSSPKLNQSSEFNGTPILEKSSGSIVESRYLKQAKMKYNLAGIDMNVDQLRHDQIQELTRLLISLKSEYDELIRETIRKKRETELLSKQCEALEKIERKIGDQHISLDHNLQELKKQIEVKQAKLEEEIFLRDSMIHVSEKLKEEILHLKKNMNNNEIAYMKNQKEYEKQKLKSTEIKEKLNQIHQRINEQKRKNNLNREDNYLISQYYNVVIENKWNFIKAGDERKEKQKKIAQDAKNDTQDKIEVEKRKQYLLIFLFNKYLKRKMERERVETQLLERTFQEIKKITGMSNIKQIVEKVTNKDKDYNLCVAKVSDRETKLNIIKEKIKKLEDQVVDLKNTASFDVNEVNTNIKNEYQDKESLDLIEQENKLKQELEEMREKSKNVEMIFEKVIDNIKNLVKFKHDDENLIDNSGSHRSYSLEDEIVIQYGNFLTKLEEEAYNSFADMTKEDFIKIMNKQSKENNALKEEQEQKENIERKKSGLKSVSHKQNSHIIHHKEADEYEEDEEDQKINEEFKGVIRSQQKSAVLEKLKQEREKENEKKNNKQ